MRRGTPQRSPYSTQLKFGMSGCSGLPCAVSKIDRGMGSSKGQTSRFTTTWTMSGLPPGGSKRGRSVAS